MESIDFTLLIPSLLSLIGSSTFLYFYYKFPSIHLAFGMNYLLNLQFTDFFFSFLNILNSFPLAYDSLYCILYYFLTHYLINLQSATMSYYFIYLYQIIYLNNPENPKRLKAFFVLFLLISAVEPFILIFFCKFDFKYNFCEISNFNHYYFISLDILFALMLLNFIWCVYSTIKMFGKFKTHFFESQKPIKWTIFRLLIFPIVNWVCILPSMVSSYIIFKSGEKSRFLSLVLYSNSCAVGFYNFLALICTDEFRYAFRLHKNLQKQKLMEISMRSVLD